MKDDVMNWEKEILQTIVLVCYADPHPQEGKENFRSSQDEMGGLQEYSMKLDTCPLDFGGLVFDSLH